MPRARGAFTAGLSLALCGFCACTVSTRRAPTPPSASLSSGSGPTSDAPTEPPPPPPKAAAFTEPDPAALALFTQTLDQPSKSLEPIADVPEVVGLAVANASRSAFGGMIPGELTGVPMAEGERATTDVSSGCMAAVAQGGLGVVEVDLFIRDPSSEAILAQDAEAGPTAMAPAGSGCTEVPEGAEVHAVLRRGTGLILVQLLWRSED